MADPSSWDLLDWDCSSLTGWTDGDVKNGVSEISPAGQLRLDANTKASGNYAYRYQDIGSIPNTFTVEIKVYHDAIGTHGNFDHFLLSIYQADEYVSTWLASDGAYIDKGSGSPNHTNIGASLVKSGASAEWQTWRFLYDISGAAGTGTVDVYLTDSTHGAELIVEDLACSTANVGTDGNIFLAQFGYTTNDMLTHVDYLKIATGLYTPGAAGATFIPQMITIL